MSCEWPDFPPFGQGPFIRGDNNATATLGQQTLPSQTVRVEFLTAFAGSDLGNLGPLLKACQLLKWALQTDDRLMIQEGVAALEWHAMAWAAQQNEARLNALR